MAGSGFIKAEVLAFDRYAASWARDVFPHYLAVTASGFLADLELVYMVLGVFAGGTDGVDEYLCAALALVG